MSSPQRMILKKKDLQLSVDQLESRKKVFIFAFTAPVFSRVQILDCYISNCYTNRYICSFKTMCIQKTLAFSNAVGFGKGCSGNGVFFSHTEVQEYTGRPT